MDNLLPVIPVVLLVLACPLVMGAMGVGAWVLARAKGERKKLSMGCMMGQCEHEEHASTEETGLKEQVTRLEQEVLTLRAQVRRNGGHAGASQEARDVLEEQERAGVTRE